MELDRDIVQDELRTVMFADVNSGDASQREPLDNEAKHSPAGEPWKGFSASSIRRLSCAQVVVASRVPSIACEDSVHAIGVLQLVSGAA